MQKHHIILQTPDFFDIQAYLKKKLQNWTVCLETRDFFSIKYYKQVSINISPSLYHIPYICMYLFNLFKYQMISKLSFPISSDYPSWVWVDFAALTNWSCSITHAHTHRHPVRGTHTYTEVYCAHIKIRYKDTLSEAELRLRFVGGVWRN